MSTTPKTKEEQLQIDNEQEKRKVRISGHIVVLFLLGAVIWGLTTFIPIFNSNCTTVGYVLLGLALFGYLVERTNRKREGDNSGQEMID